MSSAATSQDAGLAGVGRAGDHFDGAGQGEHVSDGGGLIQARPCCVACVVFFPRRQQMTAPYPCPRQAK